jgi:hypothetical protein
VALDDPIEQQGLCSGGFVGSLVPIHISYLSGQDTASVHLSIPLFASSLSFLALSLRGI